MPPRTRRRRNTGNSHRRMTQGNRRRTTRGRRRTHQHRQQGGLTPATVIRGDPTRSVFEKVISNSKVNLISYGSLYGLMFKLKLNEGVQPFHRDSLGKDNKEYIIKMGFIEDRQRFGFGERIVGAERGVRTIKQTVNTEDFVKEAQTHRDIYEKSLRKYGISIVPDVMKDGFLVLNLNQRQDVKIIEKLLSKIQDSRDQDLFRQFYSKFTQPRVISIRDHLGLPRNIQVQGKRVGLYMMKRVEGSGISTLPKRETFRNRALYEDAKRVYELKKHVYRKAHILLGMLGYIHGDAHHQNIMINYDREARGVKDVKLIDFGDVTPVPELRVERPEDVTIQTVNTIVKKTVQYCDVVRKKQGYQHLQWPCMKLFWSEVITQYPRIVVDNEFLRRMTSDIQGWWRRNLTQSEERDEFVTAQPTREATRAPVVAPVRNERARELEGQLRELRQQLVAKETERLEALEQKENFKQQHIQIANELQQIQQRGEQQLQQLQQEKENLQLQAQQEIQRLIQEKEREKNEAVERKRQEMKEGCEEECNRYYSDKLQRRENAIQQMSQRVQQLEDEIRQLQQPAQQIHQLVTRLGQPMEEEKESV